MIVLHRLTHPNEPFHLNPDSIHMVEAHPDTVVVLSTGSKLVVSETPEEVADRMREWHASILRTAAGNAPVYQLQALAEPTSIGSTGHFRRTSEQSSPALKLGIASDAEALPAR